MHPSYFKHIIDNQFALNVKDAIDNIDDEDPYDTSNLLPCIILTLFLIFLEINIILFMKNKFSNNNYEI